VHFALFQKKRAKNDYCFIKSATDFCHTFFLLRYKKAQLTSNIPSPLAGNLQGVLYLVAPNHHSLLQESPYYQTIASQ
jgi:hypothetical protein